MSHTPGPWTIVERYGDKHLQAGNESIMCDMQYYPWTPNNPDDWKLIAAAPELLAALEAAHAQLQKISYALGVDGRTADGMTKMGAILRIDAVNTDINAAIAKAKGE